MISALFGGAVPVLRAAVAVACLIVGGEAFAAQPAASLTTQDAITVYTADAAAMAPGGAAARLIERARAQGQVRVIVMLNIVMQMEHTLAGREVVRQRAALHAVQDAVATRVLGSSADQGIVRFDVIPAMSLFVNATQLRRLLADPQVVSISEDIPMPPEATASLAIIHADDLFAKGINGTGYAVAIVDVGVAKSHPAFAGGKVVSEACYSTNNAPTGISSLCPGRAASSTAAGSGVNCPTTTDGCDHGTHVASIAAGNSATYDGVARDAKIIAIKVFSQKANCAPNPSPCSTSYQTDQIKGLQRVYALRNTYKIAAVNMSYGGGVEAAPCDGKVPPYTTILNNLRAAGIAPIKSAGNSGSNNGVSFPGCITSAIKVGSSTANDRLSSFSNHSPMVDLIAPGDGINGAVPNNKYEVMSGTSMAAPHVAGSFALLRNAKPKASINDILAALKCSGKPIYQRAVAGSPAVTPVLPRIDLLGAYNRLLKPPAATRTWNFGSADDAQDWAPLRGVWNASSGNYQPTIQSRWLASTVSNCDSRLQIVASIRRVDPTPANSSDPRQTTVWNSGIFFKSTLDAGAGTVSGYLFLYNKAWYCAVTPPTGEKCPAAQLKQGQVRVFRVAGLVLASDTATSVFQPCVDVYTPINVGQFNTLKVVSDGSANSLYLNNKLVCSFTDSTFAAGAVGLMAYIPCASSPGACPTPVAGNIFQADSVSVKSLETAASAESPEAAIMDPSTFIKEFVGTSAKGVGANGSASANLAMR
jgi:subtilisin family serine protease